MSFTELGFLIAILMPINQLIKAEFLGPDKSKYVPLISIGLGILLNLLLINEGIDFRQMILNGIVAGLSAVGLFSTTKNLNIDKEFK